jgi:hypothetical protein
MRYGTVRPGPISGDYFHVQDRTLHFGSRLALFASGPARAEDAKPINLSLFTPVQIVPTEASIHGFRFSLLYGVNREMHGFDLGLVNRATGSVVGFQWGVVNWGESTLKGIQLSAVNYLEGEGLGAQVGFVNVEKAATGFQWGFVNYAPRMTGFQLGLVNVTDNLDGLQIGLVNVAKNGLRMRIGTTNIPFEFTYWIFGDLRNSVGGEDHEGPPPAPRAAERLDRSLWVDLVHGHSLVGAVLETRERRQHNL